jgi:hypothetical protein
MRSHHPIRWADDNEELQQTESQLVSQPLDSGHLSPQTSKTMTNLHDGVVEFPSCFCRGKGPVCEEHGMSEPSVMSVL